MNKSQVFMFIAGASLLSWGIYELRKNTAAKKSSAPIVIIAPIDVKVTVVETRDVQWQKMRLIAKIMYFVTEIAQCIANIARSIFVV